MKNMLKKSAMAIFLMVFITLKANGHHNGVDVYWHTDPGVTTCSMYIDPSLTQEQWKRFTRQVGAISSYKSLAPATTLGKGHFSLDLVSSITPVDQKDPAWINTFTHPDETCPLGDQIKLPMIRAKYGLNDKVDIGVLWTKAPGANYGMAGGEVKYRFMSETAKRPAAAVRTSWVGLTGVSDYNFSVASLDLMTSKSFSGFSPYLGIRGNLMMSAETTAKVDLRKERFLNPQAYLGIGYSFWRISLAVEYNVADVNTCSFRVGIGSLKNRKTEVK